MLWDDRAHGVTLSHISAFLYGPRSSRIHALVTSVFLHCANMISSNRFAIMMPRYWTILLLRVCMDFVYGQSIDHSTASNQIAVSFDAIGYSITVMIGCVIGIAHLIYWLTRLIKANTLNDNKAYLPAEGLTQRGFRRSWFGSFVKYSSFAFLAWLVVAMVLVIVGKYTGTWPFESTISEGRVDSESYIRAFVSSWLGSLTITIIIRSVHRRIDSFYLRPCSLAAASHVKFSCVVSDSDDPEQHLAVKYSKLLAVVSEPCRHVEFLAKRYTWSDSARMFQPGTFFSKDGLTGTVIERSRDGLTTSQVLDKLRRYGSNRVGVDVPTFAYSFTREIMSLFYIYQISVCWLCIFWNYITYAIVAILLVIGSAVMKVRSERRSLMHSSKLKSERSFSWVKRDGKWTKVVSEEVCVGDLVCLAMDSVETSAEVVADMLIINGEAIVDETGLSGETIPVRKRSVPADSTASYSNNSTNREFILYSGTKVLHCHGVDNMALPGNVQTGCLALVLAVGGDTTQSLLAQKVVVRKKLETPIRLELFTAITSLILVSFVCFLWVYETFGVSLDSVLPALTCIIGIFNPLLILAFTLGGTRSLSRLESSGIHAVSIERIALAGKTNLALIDKTGTLTKRGLELVGLISADSPNMIDSRMRNIPWPNELSNCVAMAHSVISSNGKLVGDQIELQMVDCASQHGWNFNDVRAPTDVYGTQWEVLQIFPFNHESMCMSVIVKQKKSGALMLLCKGSFEAIHSRCADIPDDAAQSTRLYALEGYYVLAVGTRELDRDTNLDEIRNNRNMIENELTFAGLLLFSNEVRPDSTECIRELIHGGIQCHIITGDSLPTACSVARSVGIVSNNERLITGCIDRKTGLPEWRLYETDTLMSEAALLDETDAKFCITGDLYEMLVCAGKLDLVRTKIFARMNPSQKGELVRVYASVGKVVAVCGDSGNDTFALQAAHVGLVMGGNPSIASASSFTTENDSLSDLCVLINEGRAALCNILSSYRFLVAVGIAQTVIRIVLLTQFGCYTTAVSNIVIDSVVIPLLLFAMSACAPSRGLLRAPPEGSLMGPEIILGCAWSLFVTLIMYWISTAVLTSESWYIPFSTDATVSDWSVRTNSFDSALAVIFRLWICTDLAFAYSYGSDYRRSVIFNWRLLALTFTLIGSILYTLATSSSVWNCAIGVNCTQQGNQAASESPINWFLFQSEKIGGAWHGMVDSLVFPSEFTLVVLSLLILMTIVHHAGIKFIIQGKAMDWIHTSLGWKDMISCCGCWRRTNPKGYRRLDEAKQKETSLDDSVMSASVDDSPTMEWHMTRAQGTWRVPEPLKYG